MDKAALDKYKKGKTPEQIKVIDYFNKDGCCLSFGLMKDEDYIALVYAKRDALKVRNTAIDKIGLDEDQINEIPPVHFEGWVYRDAFAKKNKTGTWVSSSYQVSLLFFSSTQVYLYVVEFKLDASSKKESTNEFFYKDVTAFSTVSETVKAKVFGDVELEVDTIEFAMTVPGDKLRVAINGTESREASIQAMKQKLREKKA